MDDVVARAQARFPDVACDLERFRRRLARHPDAREPADLFLAEACLAGDAAALAHFEQLLESLRGMVSTDPDEALQLMRVRLLTTAHESGPKLNEYGGQGPLLSWLKTVLVHTAAALHRAPLKRTAVDPLVMLDLPDEREAPDTSLARAEARAQLRDALERALERLTRKQRLLLRQHYLDGLTLEQLAAFENVHRATVARWLAGAREALLTALEGDPSIDQGLWQLVQSRLTLSIGRLLAEAS